MSYNVCNSQGVIEVLYSTKQILAFIKEPSNAWPYYRLTTLLAIPLSASAHAETALTSSDLNSVLRYALIAVIVSVIVPYIKHLHSNYIEKRAFLAFMRVNVKSTLSFYGRRLTSVPDIIESVNRNMGTAKTIPLSVSDAFSEFGEVAETTVSIATRILESKEALIAKTQPTKLPYISFVGGISAIELDHQSPIWQLKSQHVTAISEYVVSLRDIKSWIDELYSEPLVSLFNSKEHASELRWLSGAEQLLHLIILHYQLTKNLDRLLEN